MDTTEILDAINDTRKTQPYKYIWGKFTPDKEGVGFSDLPEQSALTGNDRVAIDNGGPTLISARLGDLSNFFSSTISTSSVSDWNQIGGENMYLFIESVQGVTLNSPEDVTDSWFVQQFIHDSIRVVVAMKVSNPASRYVRSYINGNWTNWVLPYASWSPGN